MEVDGEARPFLLFSKPKSNPKPEPEHRVQTQPEPRSPNPAPAVAVETDDGDSDPAPTVVTESVDPGHADDVAAAALSTFVELGLSQWLVDVCDSLSMRRPTAVRPARARWRGCARHRGPRRRAAARRPRSRCPSCTASARTPSASPRSGSRRSSPSSSARSGRRWGSGASRRLEGSTHSGRPRASLVGKQLDAYECDDRDVTKDITKVFKARRLVNMKMADEGHEEKVQARKEQKKRALARKRKPEE